MAASKVPDAVKKRLPRLQKHEGAHADKVTRRVSEILADDPGDTTHYASRFAEAKAQRDMLTDEMSALQVEIDAIEHILLKRYEDEGVASVRLSGGGLVFTRSEPYAKVTNKEAFRQWCLDNGYEREMNLLWVTTNAIMKKMLADGEKEPPGVEAFMNTSLQFRKSGASDA